MPGAANGADCDSSVTAAAGRAGRRPAAAAHQTEPAPQGRPWFGVVRRVYSRSNTAAIPWPPPMHIVTSA
jgi:hypothetical protein